MSYLKQVIVALDNMNAKEALDFLEKTQGKITWAKVGMELFYRFGPRFLEEIHQRFGVNIFLDLKLHDIPNTVAKAIESLQNLPIKLLTIHLSGGENMLLAAANAKERYIPQCTLLGVSYLTSLDSKDFKEMWNLDESQMLVSFEKLIRLALRTQIGGVVLSAQELQLTKSIVRDFAYQSGRDSAKLLKVCPGIRFHDEFAGQKTQDQKRVATPEAAIQSGADFLVIGRSLTASNNLDARLAQLATTIN